MWLTLSRLEIHNAKRVYINFYASVKKTVIYVGSCKGLKEFLKIVMYFIIIGSIKFPGRDKR